MANEVVKVAEGSAVKEIAVLARGMAPVTPFYLDPARGVPVVAVPDGTKVVELSDTFPDMPDRIRRDVAVTSVESFVAYVNRFKNPNTVIFADVFAGKYRAEIDYHGAGEDGEPSFCTHRADLVLTKTEEFAAWDGADGKAFAQADFAQFIEDRLPDISAPAGADMLELAKSLEVTSGVQFTGRVSLATDARVLQYQEEVTAKAGQLEIPEKFNLYLVPFFGMPPVSLECRFRYKIEKPTLRLSFTILRKAQCIVKMCSGAADVVGNDTGCPVYQVRGL